MSDEHLRQLERAWRASGTVEDEAAWLVARFEEIARNLAEEQLWREAREEDEARRRGHDRPALRPEPTFWDRVRAFLGGPDAS